MLDLSMLDTTSVQNSAALQGDAALMLSDDLKLQQFALPAVSDVRHYLLFALQALREPCSFVTRLCCKASRAAWELRLSVRGQ